MGDIAVYYNAAGSTENISTINSNVVERPRLDFFGFLENSFRNGTLVSHELLGAQTFP